MIRPALFAATAAAALALIIPTAARADFGIRAGLEAPIVTHVNDGGSFNIGDSFQPSLDLLAQFGPSDFIAFGLEGCVNFASTSNFTCTGNFARARGDAEHSHPADLYLRASLPIRLEPNAPELGLRLAAGFKLNFLIVGIYLEAAADMPFVGNDVSGNSESAFSHQTFSLGAGVEIRL